MVTAIIFDDSPKSIRLRPVRRALIHQGGRAQCERTINNVTVAGDPADVRCAPVKILVAQIEDIFRRRINPEQIAAGGVQNSFRFSGRAAGVKNVKRMLGIECHRLAIRIDVFQLAMPPNVAAFFHVNFIARSPENDDTFDRGAAAESMIDILFQRDNRAAAIAAIRRDQRGRPTIRDAIANASALNPPKTTECTAPMRAQASIAIAASGNRRQINDDAIAFANFVSLQDVGETANFAM